MEKTYKIPVTWEVYGTVEVKASSVEEALKKYHDIEDKGDDQFEISDGRSVDEVYQALLDHQLQPVMNDYVYL